MKPQELLQELDTKFKKRTFIESIFSLLKEMYFLKAIILAHDSVLYFVRFVY